MDTVLVEMMYYKGKKGVLLEIYLYISVLAMIYATQWIALLLFSFQRKTNRHKKTKEENEHSKQI